MSYIQKNWASILTIAFLIFVILAIITPFVLALQGLRNEGAWPDWTGFGEYIGPPINNNEEFRPPKTLWDIMQLLIVPLFLGFSAIWINKVIRENEKRRTAEKEKIEKRKTEEQQQEEAIQHYLDKMSELLIEKEVLEKIKDEDEAILGVARGRTVSTLRMLNRNRQNILLSFIRDANLADHIFKGANLSDARLEETYLWSINLIRADLRGANLREANLWRADLKGANLREADLRGANLREADLREAELRGADLRGADLWRANLEEARYNDNTKWPLVFNVEKSGARHEDDRSSGVWISKI